MFALIHKNLSSLSLRLMFRDCLIFLLMKVALIRALNEFIFNSDFSRFSISLLTFIDLTGLLLGKTVRDLHPLTIKKINKH